MSILFPTLLLDLSNNKYPLLHHLYIYTSTVMIDDLYMNSMMKIQKNKLLQLDCYHKNKSVQCILFEFDSNK